MNSQTFDGFSVHEDGKRRIIRFHDSGCVRVGLSLFLMIWLSGWSMGCVMLLSGLVTNFEWFALLFSTPFFVAWIAVIGVLIATLFGRQEVTLDGESMEVVYRAIVPWYSRMTAYKEILSLETICENSATELVAKTTGKPIKITSSGSAEKIAAFQQYLYEQIPSLSHAKEPGSIAKTETVV